jgi:hypothetical protein
VQHSSIHSVSNTEAVFHNEHHDHFSESRNTFPFAERGERGRITPISQLPDLTRNAILYLVEAKNVDFIGASVIDWCDVGLISTFEARLIKIHTHRLPPGESFPGTICLAPISN